MTAIRATFSDFKLVRGRKVAQLVFEVPIEEADSSLRSLGGVPRPDTEQWVGIAPLTREASQPQKRSWGELTRAQQAGIRCNEPEFQRWILRSHYEEVVVRNFAPEACANRLRDFLNVKSRAELDTNEEAGKRWDALDAEFRARR